MIRKIIPLLVFLVGTDFIGYAQPPTLVNLTPPSPNVQAMQKYGDIPVSAYTGIPDISIPIYTAKFRDLSIPISLSYHASGIKVAEEASQVGLGWVLNAGGSISRNIIGVDDFTGNYFTSGIMDMDAGQGPTNRVTQGCNLQMFNSTGIGNTIYNYDVSNFIRNFNEFQPDQYYYNFSGRCGKFIMNRTFQAIIQKQEPIQITCQSPSGNSWEVQSTDGYIYDFTLQETYKDPSTFQQHICAWYLTSITSPTGNRAVFNYTPNPTVIQGLGSWSEQRDDFQFTLVPGVQAAPGYGPQRGLSAGYIYSNQLLSSIELPNSRVQFYYSGNRADLSGDQRLDSVSVFVKDKSGNVPAVPIKTTSLSYGYFNYGDDDDYAFGGPSTGSIFSQRMKLLQMQNTGYYGGGSASEPPYVFTYYEGDMFHNLPSKGSFARDHWGYYNGKTDHNSLIPSVEPVSSDDEITFALGIQGPERNPDTAFVHAFSLQSIQYPTGGTTRFQYESNDFDEINSEVNDNTYFSRVPEVMTTHVPFDYDAYDHILNSPSDTLDLTNEYIAPGLGGGFPAITIVGAFRFSTSQDCSVLPHPQHSMYFALFDTLGNEIQEFDLASYTLCSGGSTNSCYLCGSGVFSLHTQISLNPGKYIFKAVNTGQETNTLESIDVDFSFPRVVQTLPNTTPGPGQNYYVYGGGQRIARIVDQDPLNPAINKVHKYVYHYWTDKTGAGTPQEYSFGRRMSKPEYAYFAYNGTSSSVQLASQCETVGPYYTFHVLRGSNSDNPLNGSAAGAVVGYDQVTELLGENGEYGQKVYQYNNLPDLAWNYADPVSQQNLPLCPPYGSNIPNALNGTLTREIDYANNDGALLKVKDVVNKYETVLASRNYAYGLYNNKLNAVGLGDQCSMQLSDVCDGGSSLTYTYVSMPSEWQRIVSSDEKDFNQGDSVTFLDTYTQYFYDNPVHKQPTRTVTTNSKGQVITSATQYPLDFPNPTATDAFTLGVAKLQQSHVIDRPVEKHVDKTNADGSQPRTVSAYLSYFNAATPTQRAVYRTENASPITGFSPAAISSSGLTSSPFYQPYIYFDQYDGYGNILQQHKTSDLPHSYIWDYNSSLLVAEATNAIQSDVAYTSFEADGTGNWTIASAITDDSTAITGTQSYNLGNGNISKTGLQTGNTYIVSYWSRNGAYAISGATGSVRTGRSVNGWTYYEHTVVASATTVVINGSGNIDELRLYPAGAQMTTYTYSPLIGITSQCDAGSRITYYEYDGLGRLQDIKDQDGNILKTYEYQYQYHIGE